MPAATPTMEPPQRVEAGESIAPLTLNNSQALTSELSQVELDCLAEFGSARRLLTLLQTPDMASPEEAAELILCLRNRTLLRLFLTGITGPAGPLSGETSDCIRAGFAGLDLRSIVAAGPTGGDEGGYGVAFHLAIACLNEVEWAAAAPSLGLSLNYREGVQCFMRELGGPEEVAEALQRSEQETSFGLIAVAVGCGLSESDLAALTAAPPAAAPEDSISVIAPLNIEDPAAFMSGLSPTEQSCVSVNIGPQQLARIMSAPGLAIEEGDTIIECLEDETLLRLFITGLIGLTEPLSAESSVCIRGGVEDIDLRSLMSAGPEGNEQTAMMVSMSAYMTTLSCLNDEEWQAASAVTGMAPGERENLQCVMGQMGGAEGIAEALQSEDGSGVIALLTAAVGCGLQLEMGAGPGG